MPVHPTQNPPLQDETREGDLRLVDSKDDGSAKRPAHLKGVCRLREVFRCAKVGA